MLSRMRLILTLFVLAALILAACSEIRLRKIQPNCRLRLPLMVSQTIRRKPRPMPHTHLRDRRK